MAHRTFIDSLGRSWDVWSVIPERADRRTQSERSSAAPDRRYHTEVRVRLGPKWMNGWLAFETPGEKRRLAPIPESWVESADGELERLCQSAEPIATRKRRLIE